MKNWSLFGILLFALGPVLVVSFQNCAPANFSTQKPETSQPIDGGQDPQAGFSLLEQRVHTAYQQPVTFVLRYQGTRLPAYQFSFAGNSLLLQQVIPGIGVIELVDASLWQLRFTPESTYRGEFQLPVFILDSSNASIAQASITVTVGHSVNFLQPALALRATGCVMCHAQLSANVITDFGHQSPFYFGNNIPTGFAWNDGTPYGDHEALFNYNNGYQGTGAWARAKFENSQLKVIVPPATLPSAPAQATGTTTLKGYLDHRLQASEYAPTRGVEVQITSEVNIKSVTPALLKERFNWGTEHQIKGYKWISSPASPWSLAGININPKPTQQLYQNQGVVVCEGDLLLDGSLLLDQVRIRTLTGCRIYVTGNIYIYGAITFDTSVAGHSYENRNLQLVSAQAILMGLGQLWKSGRHCEEGASESGYYQMYLDRNEWTKDMSASEAQRFNTSIADSLKYRLQYFWGIPLFYTRQHTNPKAWSEQLYQQTVAHLGTREDAACEPLRRNVGFERLLLNAPMIHNRYAGGIKGSVIAEFALMPLGLAETQSRFRFDFDPVFSKVEILPILRESDFLQVK